LNGARQLHNQELIPADIMPPSEPAIEAQILGEILVYPESIITAIEIISEEHFYIQAHELIYSAILELNGEEKPIDTTTVYDKLKKKDQLDEVGGAVFLSKISKNIISAANIAEHCKIILEKYLYRKIITIAQESARASFAQEEDVFDLIPGMAEQLYNLLEVIQPVSADRTMGEDLTKTFEHIEKVAADESGKEGGLLSVSMPSFNHFTNGLQGGDVMLIKGDMKQGKTTLALKLALDFVLGQGVPTAIFNYEMGQKSVYHKNLSMMTGVAYQKLRNPKGIRGKNKLEPKEMQGMMDKAYNIKDDLKLYVYDEILERRKLKARMKKLKTKFNIGCFVVDYLQLMPTNQKFETKTLEVSDNSRFFKVLAKELNTAIILLTQVNVSGASFLSRGPEMDADFVITVTKPLENDVKSTKNKWNEKFEFEKDHFLIKLDYSRHGENQIQFVAGFLDNDFREIDIDKKEDERYEKKEPGQEEIF